MTVDSRPSILTPLSRPLVLALPLFGFNAYICHELFTTEYLVYLDSIEGAYIGLARWIVAHPWEWGWFPLWYGGIPFQNAYPPLLHFLTAAISAFGGLSPALAHHVAGATMYSAGPAFLFLFAWRISGKRWTSFFAALLYSSVSFSSLLIPGIAREAGSVFASRRLDVLARYGEGPHVASLALLPLAWLLLHRSIERPTPPRVLLASLGLAAVVLTNWLGAVAVAAGVLAYLLAVPEQNILRAWLRAAAIGLLAYCLAAPWIPPSTIAAIRRNSEHIGGNFTLTGTHLIYAVILFAAAALGSWMLRRAGAGPLLRFAVANATLAGAPVVVWFWFHTYLLPQPHRYQLEMEIPVALAVAFGAASLLGRLNKRARSMALVALLIPLAVFARQARHVARGRIRSIDMERTIQCRIARWCGENLRGRRVLAAGSVRFWLNAFADTPQLDGGFGPGVSNPQIPHVIYGVLHSEGDAERAAMWLRAYGVEAVIVSGPDSKEPYKDFRDPGKFTGVLPELWTTGAETVYTVPAAQSSLARIIPRATVVNSLHNHYTDVSPLRPLATVIDEPALPRASFQWVSPHEAAIEANLPAGYALSVAVTWDPGWRATTAGAAVPIRGDALGLMVLDPGEGRRRIRLVYDGGREAMAARGASAATALFFVVWWLVERRRRRAR